MDCIKKKEMFIREIIIFLNLSNKSRRNIHVGIDIFAKAGTNIRAPLDGKVHILKDNAILNMTMVQLLYWNIKLINLDKFYTIYGHLSKKCLKVLKVGQKIKKGQINSSNRKLSY